MEKSEVHLLFIEDDEIDIRAVKRGFARHHITNPVTFARDGLEALAVLRGNEETPALPRPRLIFLDINMPRMNGLEFLEEIRSDPDLRDSVVFVLSTSDDERDVATAYRNHVAGYFLKSRVGDEFHHLADLIGKFNHMVRLPSG